jgi:hypothetical protein
MTPARELKPAAVTYKGAFTDAGRWAGYRPRKGDIIVCTPSKCGTTWTQAIVANLLSGGCGLPAPVPVISPWIDMDTGDAASIAAALEAQPGRRVIKTHTPADGFPVWEGVHVVAVYRHPLDVYLSLRKHGMNMKARPDHPMRRPMAECFRDYLNADFLPDAVDEDTLALLVSHYNRTAATPRVPLLTVLHYADMVADHAGAVAGLARALVIDADRASLARVVEATAFGAMKEKAKDYVPLADTGFWTEDAAFFDKGGTGKWDGQFTEAQLRAYASRMAELVPNDALRRWLETGGPFDHRAPR